MRSKTLRHNLFRHKIHILTQKMSKKVSKKKYRSDRKLKSNKTPIIVNFRAISSHCRVWSCWRYFWCVWESWHVQGLTGSLCFLRGRNRSVKIRDWNSPSVRFSHAEEITEVLPSVISFCWYLYSVLKTFPSAQLCYTEAPSAPSMSTYTHLRTTTTYFHCWCTYCAFGLN